MGRVSLQKKQCHAPLKKCLFIYFYFRVLSLCCLVRASSAHWATLSGGTGALDSRASAVATHGLNSCNFWAPEHRLRRCGVCLVAPWYGGIFQDQGSNPPPMHWQANSLPLVPARKPYTYGERVFLQYSRVIGSRTKFKS